MKCTITVNDYIPVVKDLVALDSEKYTNYDNIVSFILERKSINDEQKALAILATAHILNGLKQVEPESYQVGRASDIIDMFQTSDSHKDFIEKISEGETINKTRNVSLDTIVEKIQKIDTVPHFVRADLVSEILKPLKNFFDTTEFASDEAKEDAISQIREILISKLNSSSFKNKSTLITQAEDFFKNQKPASSFISLQSIAEEANLKTFIVSLRSDNSIVEAYRDDENNYINLSTGEPIPNSDILKVQDGISFDTSKENNAGEQIFKESELLGAFKVYPIVDSSNQTKRTTVAGILQNLQSLGSPKSSIEIFVVKNNKVQQDRVNRIHKAAERIHKPLLKNRTLETFENNTQKNFLQQNNNGVVLTVSRSSDLTLMGRNKVTGETFVLYSFDNYAFVYADNKTIPVDFSNKGHQELVKKLSKKKTETGFINNLSDEDIQQLSDTFAYYQKFKEEILNTVDFTKTNSVDVTNLFHNYYTLFANKEYKSYVDLKKFIEDSPMYHRPLTIVTYDSATGVVSEESEERKIPFIFTRSAGSVANVDAEGNLIDPEKPYIVSTNFNVKNYLNDNERILHKGKVYTMEKYAREVLGLTTNFIDVHVLKQTNVKTQKNILIRFLNHNIPSLYEQPGGNFGWKTVEPVQVVDVNTKISDYISTLLKIKELNKVDRAKALRDFDKKEGFYGINKGQLYINISFDASLLNYQLEIIPNSEKYDFIKDIKSKFKFVLPINELEAVNNEPDSQKKLQMFNELLKKNVIDKLDSQTEGTPFIDLLREDLKTKEGISDLNQLLFGTSPSGIYPRLQITDKQRKLSNRTFDNIKVLNISKGLSIVPRSVRPLLKTTVKEAKKETPVTTAPKTTDIKSSGLNDLPAFSIEDRFDSTTQTQIDSEISYLKKILPQFGIEQSDLSTILDLAKYDGNVLGFYKDAVIYLNKNLKSKGTAYHEAFHGVFRHILSTEERTALISNVQSNKKYASKFTEKALREFAQQRHLVFDVEKIKQLVAEEILADGFREYMNGKQAPKGIIGKLFELLKKLINLFTKHKDEIELLYNKINSGYYASESIKAGIYDGEMAFELIPGINAIVRGSDGITYIQRNATLQTAEQDQLINAVTYFIHKDTSSSTFDEKFDRVAVQLIDNQYNLDKHIAQNPAAENLIRKKVGRLFANYVFMLGGAKLGHEIIDVNETNDEAYNNQSTERTITTDEGTRDNTMGEVSVEILKKLVKSRLNAYETLVGESEKESVISEKVIEDEVSGENLEIEENENEDINEELDQDTQDFDKNVLEFNALDSQPTEIKRFLAMIPYELHDKETGISYFRMLNGYHMYGSLLKINADIDRENVVNHIYTVAKQYERDGLVENAAALMAVYNGLFVEAKLDKDTHLPQGDPSFFNMFLNSMDICEQNIMLLTINSETNSELAQFGIESAVETKSFTMKDSILYTDTNTKKSDIIISMMNVYKSNKNNSDYAAAVDEIIEDVATYFSSTTTEDLLGDYPDSELEKLVDRFKSNLDKIGLNVPKSLLALSFMAINDIERKKGLTVKENDNINHYNNHKNYISEKVYLEGDFFSDLAHILKETKRGVDIVFLLDDKSKDLKIKRFNTILRRAAEYIVKYDPTMLPNTIKTADGKKKYRFGKYTPVMAIANDIRRNGLLNTIQEDFYWDRFLKDYLNDNPYLKGVLNNDNDPRSQKLKTFFNNFKVGYFDGVNQRLDKYYKEGKTFKDIDDMSFHMLSIMSFLQRYEHVVEGLESLTGEKEKIITYNRSLTQNEATNTHFLVSAIHNANYVAQMTTGTIISKKNNIYNIVPDLESIVKQEYNRIIKEWTNRELNKRNYESGVKNDIVNGYNGKLNPDGITVNVDAPSLKAYNFSKLRDFFDLEPDIKSSLLGHIIREEEPVQFDDLPEEVRKELTRKLNTYVDNSLNTYLDELVQKNVVQKITDEKGTRYTSKFINPYTLKFSVNGVAGNTIAEQYRVSTGKDYDLKLFLSDVFFNHWFNSLMFNDIFTGEEAMNVKNSVDYFKRAKKNVAAGNRGMNTHTVAYINTLEAFISDTYPMYGPYYSEEEIVNDRATDEETKAVLLAEYNKGNNKMMREIFDGQSISTLMHQMEMHDSEGRLDDKAKELLIAKHYRDLDEDEIETLRERKIVNNAKKTVTASRNSYHKSSEIYIDRNDVSRLVVPKGMTKEQVLKEIHNLYTQIYDARTAIKKSKQVNESADPVLVENIKRASSQIHSYYEALPNRKQMFDILNSMEYYNIDQLMDTTASKNATLLPVTYNSPVRPEGYINLGLSSVEIDSKYKYNQVETSGVKEKGTISVQHKLLLAADIEKSILTKYFQANNIVLSPEQQKSFERLEPILTKYQSTLKDVANANFNYLTRVLRDDKDFNIGKVYDLIRENLIAQNASQATLDLFETTPSGEPVYNPNLPEIRSMFNYYFFSQYSKSVTDEKGAGTKYVHQSSFGMDVIVDKTTNAIIPTHVYRDSTKLTEDDIYTRPLGVSIEAELDEKGVPTGNKIYHVECIIPKPLFHDNPKKMQFFMENLTKLFATRIPTEDKRSMIALKIVDFVDSSQLNTIIVPHFIHLLAGSDFDIDSLYTQAKAFYKTLNGDYNLYGEYSNYSDEKTGKFLEFINYISEKPEFKALIKAEKEEISSWSNHEMNMDVKMLLHKAGFPVDVYTRNYIDLDALRESYEMSKLFYGAKQEKNYILQKIRNDVKDGKGIDYKVYMKMFKVKQYIIDNQEEMKKLYFQDAYLTLYSALSVLSKYGFPVSVEEFNSDPKLSSIVTPAAQNNNLDAKLAIMTNQVVFEKLFINERSSKDAYIEIADKFGTDVNKIGIDINHHTLTGINRARSMNSINKSSIGITASMNKSIALATQYGGFKLEDDNVIWDYVSTDAEGKLIRKSYRIFGNGITADGSRVIAAIGNILGMNADGAKEPIPSALFMKTANLDVTLTMIALGMNQDFAIAFNFLPEIRNAVQNYETSSYALSDSINDSRIFFNNALKAEYLENPDTKEKFANAYNELVKSGLIANDGLGSSIYKFKLNSHNLIIDFEQQLLDQEKIRTNTLTPENIGFKVSSIKNPALSTTAQTLVLLSLYGQQVQQNFAIKRVGRITDLFKSLKPDEIAFENILETIRMIETNDTVFTAESINKLKDETQVWKVLIEAMKDADEQSKILFMEKAKYFKPIYNSFRGLFNKKSTISRTLTAYVGIKGLQTHLLGSRTSENPDYQNMFNQDDQNLTEIFTPDFWFNNTMNTELNEMVSKYPNNKFLEMLRLKKTEETATRIISEDEKETRPFHYVGMIGKSKLNVDLAKEIEEDAAWLFKREVIYMRKLFYQEIARTGMQPTADSFLRYLPAFLKKNISENIERFISLMKTGETRNLTMKDFREYLNLPENADDEEVHEFLRDLMVNMVDSARNDEGNKIPIVSKVSFHKNSNLINHAFKGDKNAARGYVSKIFDIELNDKVESITSQTFSKSSTLKINLNMDNIQANNEVAKKLGIKYDTVGKEAYFFPTALKIGKSVYILKAVDNLDNSLGETLYETLSGKKESFNLGRSAMYYKLEDTLMSKDISPVGYTLEQSLRYKELVSKKTHLYNPMLDIGEEMVKDLTPEMFEDYSTPVEEEFNIPEEEYTGEAMSEQDNTNMLLSLLGETPQEEPKATKLFNAADKTLRKGSVVNYNGVKYLFWNQNELGKAQLINADGTKYSGTPMVDKLEVLGNYVTVNYNNISYIVTDKGNIYSGATGKLVFTNKDGSTTAKREKIIKDAYKSIETGPDRISTENGPDITLDDETIC